jgi:hypothetical protein
MIAIRREYRKPEPATRSRAARARVNLSITSPAQPATWPVLIDGGVPIEVKIERRCRDRQRQDAVAELDIEPGGIALAHSEHEVGFADDAEGGEGVAATNGYPWRRVRLPRPAASPSRAGAGLARGSWRSAHPPLLTAPAAGMPRARPWHPCQSARPSSVPRSHSCPMDPRNLQSGQSAQPTGRAGILVPKSVLFPRRRRADAKALLRGEPPIIDLRRIRPSGGNPWPSADGGGQESLLPVAPVT